MLKRQWGENRNADSEMTRFRDHESHKMSFYPILLACNKMRRNEVLWGTVLHETSHCRIKGEVRNVK